MNRHTQSTPFHALVAVAALLLIATLSLPALAAGGPDALQIPQQMPAAMRAGGQGAAMGGMTPGMSDMHGGGPMGRTMMGSTSRSTRPCPMRPAAGQLPGGSPEDPAR